MAEVRAFKDDMRRSEKHGGWRTGVKCSNNDGLGSFVQIMNGVVPLRKTTFIFSLSVHNFKVWHVRRGAKEVRKGRGLSV